ncbi:MAG: aminotransferase class V-fold PLP-dependent enzyme [Puniceicoccales bacterium]|jgi:cysteine desulfurase/selenocysteine lyase|nr:aminotransferase class V-fold PLP-dependent enzyme [Puniceicoccales bacterium]
MTSNSHIDAFRAHFPILETTLPNGKPLIYLDSAATSQLPFPVISAMTDHWMHRNANVHRGIYYLAEQANMAYHQARQTLARFFHVNGEEIVFTRGATEGLNLLASCWGPTLLHPGDEMLITIQEHHSNFLPWQRLCRQCGASLRILKFCSTRDSFHKELERHLHPKVKILALAHITHVLGEIRDIPFICQLAHAYGTQVVVDGAQTLLHGPVNLRSWDCDAFVTSAHKAFGPTGIGFLFAKSSLWENISPYHLGGGMVEQVTPEKSSFKRAPERFEAGTPNIVGAIGFAAAIDFIRTNGDDWVSKYEKYLSHHALDRLRQIHGLRLCPVPEHNTGIFSFTMDGIHPHDIATWLNEDGIAIRAGHHCAQPLMTALGVLSTARLSLAPYNTLEELDALEKSLCRLQRVFH